MSNEDSLITIEDHGEVLLIVLDCPQITDFSHAEQLTKSLIQAVESHDAKHVIIDMTKLTMMTTAGYGPFISLRKKIAWSGGRLVLCQLNDIVYQLFSATQMLINPYADRFGFECTPTREEAFKQLEQE